jgi:hypothetical protein
MELLPLLRWGWRRRLVLVGALVAAVAAFVVLSGSRSSGATSSAVAWTQATLDTPRSQLAAAAPTGADTLPWRASLVVHLMATNASTREIASRIGVNENEVQVVDPSLSAATVQTAMAAASAEAATQAVTPYTVLVFLADPGLPVISIEAGAPQSSAAERLAAATVAVLKSQASSGGSFISPIRTDSDPLANTLQPFGIDQVAPIQVKLFPASTLSLKAIAGALFVFVLCCVLGSQLARRIRPRRRALAA